MFRDFKEFNSVGWSTAIQFIDHDKEGTVFMLFGKA